MFVYCCLVWLGFTVAENAILLWYHIRDFPLFFRFSVKLHEYILHYKNSRKISLWYMEGKFLNIHNYFITQGVCFEMCKKGD